MDAGVWIIVVIIIIVVIAVVAWIVYRYFYRDVNGGGGNGTNGTNGGGGGGTTIPDIFAREYDAFVVKLGIVKREIGEIATVTNGFPASCQTPFKEFIIDIPELATMIDRIETEGTKPISEIFKDKSADLLRATDIFDQGVINTANDLADGQSSVSPLSNCHRYIVSSNLLPTWSDFVKEAKDMSSDVVRLRELSNL